LNGATVKDKVREYDGKKSEEIKIRARGIINATGPFTDSIRKMDEPTVQEIVAPSSGVHVILPGYFSPSDMGLIDPNTSDGRVIFFLPWQGNTIAGTTDAPTDVAQNPIAGEEEIDWILSEIRGYLQPDIDVRRGDVLRRLKDSFATISSHSLIPAYSLALAANGRPTAKWPSKLSTKLSKNSDSRPKYSRTLLE
jgi:glycerol-3-phosphate dehydrogenase